MPVPNFQTRPVHVPYVHQEYPKAVYQANGKHKEVRNPEEESKALLEGWSLAQLPQAPPVPAQNMDTPHCKSCADNKAAFDRSWKALTDQHTAVLAENANLKLALSQTGEDSQSLVALRVDHEVLSVAHQGLQEAHAQVQADARELLQVTSGLQKSNDEHVARTKEVETQNLQMSNSTADLRAQIVTLSAQVEALTAENKALNKAKK